MDRCRTAYALKSRYEGTHHGGHFFDRETLRFFGERMSEMRLLAKTEDVTDVSGDRHECYVLSSLQRKHPLGPRRVYHYFDVDSYDQVIL